MQISGWGNYPVIDSKIIQPGSFQSARHLLSQHQFNGIVRGKGRSYGDSSLAKTVLQTASLDHYLQFDEQSGSLTCQAGVELADILDTFVPRGWFLPVTPGTKYISVGGAVASDVHGKNHHLDGSFCDHVQSLKLLLANGEITECSESLHTDLFHATCGGMGLTGVILEVTFTLKKIQSSQIEQTTIKVANLDLLFDLFEENHQSTYSVAWLDCLSSGSKQGRSLLFLGEHSLNNQFSNQVKRPLNVPVMLPGFILNRYTSQAFSELYYYLGPKTESMQAVHYNPYFYPLDSIHNWNRIYGKRGFVQYQFVIPRENGKEGIKTILDRITSSKRGSFLSVLKAFGKGNNNLLSFPTEGYTLALDFKIYDGLFEFLDTLDEIVLEYGGRIYLAKDARMSESVFKNSYPEWQKFVQLREQYGADKVFNSHQSRRLGL